MGTFNVEHKGKQGLRLRTPGHTALSEGRHTALHSSMVSRLRPPQQQWILCGGGARVIDPLLY